MQQITMLVNFKSLFLYPALYLHLPKLKRPTDKEMETPDLYDVQSKKTRQFIQFYNYKRDKWKRLHNSQSAAKCIY
jgi:hypothetical protein